MATNVGWSVSDGAEVLRMSRVMLLDSASLYYRAFYGRKGGGRTATGVPLNAVTGFFSSIAAMIAEHQPDHVVACWDDAWRPAWRVALLPEYKADRVADSSGAEDAPDDLLAQVPLIRAGLAEVNIPVVGAADCEADDVIGTLATQWVRRGRGEVLVVSGDRDLFQLVDDQSGTAVLYPVRGSGWTLITNSYLQDTFGVLDGKAYEDFSVLRGDASDGLPGVKGIGVKTAAQLLRRYGDLVGIRQAAASADDGLTPRQLDSFAAAATYLDAATKVVRVLRDAPVDVDVARGPTDDGAEDDASLLDDPAIDKILEQFRTKVSR